MKGPNLTRRDERKIGAMLVAMVGGVPAFGILFDAAGLIDHPTTPSALAFLAAFALLYSLPMIAFYIAIKDKVPRESARNS